MSQVAPEKNQSKAVTTKVKKELSDIHAKREWGAEIGVGATALWVANVRAGEENEANPLFVDPYAKRFLFGGIAEKIESELTDSLSHYYYMKKDCSIMSKKLKPYYVFPRTLGEWYVKKHRKIPLDPERVRTTAYNQRIGKF